MGLIKDIRDIEQIQLNWNNPYIDQHQLVLYLSMAISRVYSGRINSKDIHKYIEDLLKKTQRFSGPEMINALNSDNLGRLPAVIEFFDYYVSEYLKLDDTSMGIANFDIVENINNILGYMLSLNYINGK